ncbi:GNAT family N-acetyltransferase [Rheinheimera soli]|uniref:GNAT family N-acetyltransferase n=1 Tax=Rheinheimera soli TaxID=443616 RepID=UPI001E2CB2A0|nr:GNAT family N-acetyltransferase [Rheinheimera soli]
MIDPMESLIGLQEALIARTVQLQKCELHPSIRVLLDHPNDTPRFTYAIIEDNKVQAIALFVLTDPVSGTPCFQIGYAVIEKMRNKGVGKKILEEAIEELTHGLSRSSIKEFYLEAIVSTFNEASNKIATKLISAAVKCDKDAYSDEQAYQYLRKICTSL